MDLECYIFCPFWAISSLTATYLAFAYFFVFNLEPVRPLCRFRFGIGFLLSVDGASEFQIQVA